MLRDPHHDLNLLSFRDFVAGKPANDAYDYENRYCCACGQFARHIGLYTEWMSAELHGPDIWSRLNRLAMGPIPHTYVGQATRVTWGELLQGIDKALSA